MIEEDRMRERSAMLLQSGLISEAEQHRAELLMTLARQKSGPADPLSQMEWKAVMDLCHQALTRGQDAPKKGDDSKALPPMPSSSARAPADSPPVEFKR